MRGNDFCMPDWLPQVEEGSRILVVGSSGGIGQALVNMLLCGSKCVIGAHYASAGVKVDTANERVPELIQLEMRLTGEKSCKELVETFVKRAGGMEGLVILCGGITRNAHWNELSEKEWNSDINLNLNLPFFLSRAAMAFMKPTGGRIVLTGTESSIHGGSPFSLAYGVAKRGIECLVQGLAREGAPDAVLVNGLRLGFFNSGFHQRWQNKSAEDLVRRSEMIPLKRGGEPNEAAAFIIYLLSAWAGFITGQMLALTGGDWL